MITDLLLLVGVGALIAVYVSWTAGRLDRMHARVDAAWAALETQLVRRESAAREVAHLLPPGPELSALSVHLAAVHDATEHRRDGVENALTRTLRAAIGLVPATAEGEAALTELDAASSRVGLARSFHNSAVADTLVLRRRRLPRLLRLAGHRAVPAYFDVDDTALRPTDEAGRN